MSIRPTLRARRGRDRLRRPVRALACVTLAALSGAAAVRAEPPEPRQAPEHGRLDVVLQRYVSDAGVDYARWQAHEKDLAALQMYVTHLEGIPVSELEKTPNGRNEALAYWLNLYNATTLRLVLSDYPIDSIKDLGGLFSSPWDRELVTVEGDKLTLNDIENEIIRPRFGDARIHFALNCAAKSCPPLRAGAYFGDHVDEQLEEQARSFLGNPAFNRIDGNNYRLSKIFDWYREDFEKAAGSVGAFVRPYLAKDGTQTPADDAKVKHFDYDWALNDSGQ